MTIYFGIAFAAALAACGGKSDDDGAPTCPQVVDHLLALTKQHWDDCVTADEAARQLAATISGRLQQGALYHDGQIIAAPQPATDSALADRVFDATLRTLGVHSLGL